MDFLRKSATGPSTVSYSTLLQRVQYLTVIFECTVYTVNSTQFYSNRIESTRIRTPQVKCRLADSNDSSDNGTAGETGTHTELAARNSVRHSGEAPHLQYKYR